MTEARIPLVERKDDLSAEARRAWDEIARSRGRVFGPFTALLQSPEMARRIAHLGAYVRFESALEPVDRELAILATARAMDCRYEWAAHVPLAREAGVRQEAIAAIRERRAPAGLTGEEAEIVAYVTRLLRDHRVDDATFAAARERLGVPRLVELTATAGYYAMLACALNAFAIAPDPGADVLPD
ncbi:MAG: carboxymuconolactone decarboxylase family protein [Candidatus Rokuibacteriota bacterium]